MYITAYPQTVYDELVKALNGQSRVFDALLASYPEWAAFANAVQGDREAIFWLLKYDFKEIGVLANALADEPNATEWLKHHDDPFLYQFLQAAKGEETGMQFLKQTRYKTFVPLAKAVRQARKIRIKNETFWYRVF
ncbi:MAG: hypothetical protein K2O01_02810 [Bacteroidales bacterium]|nr:hypothetical protein [Bacteroidales bacterium]